MGILGVMGIQNENRIILFQDYIYAADFKGVGHFGNGIYTVYIFAAN